MVADCGKFIFTERELNEITKVIIGSAIKVHRELGPGLLESAYQSCLNYELNKTGLNVQQQGSCALVYQDLFMETGYRLDLLIENKDVVEIKSVEALNDVAVAEYHHSIFSNMTPCRRMSTV